MKAVRHAARAHETATAAASVIAARMEMGRIAMGAPSIAANGEAAAMMTEKLVAFSEAGVAMAGSSGELAARQMRYAMDETARGGAAIARLAACKTPMDVAMVQSQLFADFFTRGITHTVSLGALAMRAGDAGLRPIHRTVTANAKRLKTS